MRSEKEKTAAGALTPHTSLLTPSLRIPMKFKRIGGRKEIIVPHGLTAPTRNGAAVQKPMVLLLAKAHHWRDLLEAGKFASVTELAETLGLDLSYVSRILRLTLLAPDIVEAILAGREPSGLSIERLRAAIPADWEAQRELFG